MDGITNLTKLIQTRDSGALRPSASANPTAATSAAPDAGVERVTLTEAARALLTSRAPTNSDSPVDANRVAALRQAIADGTYTVDAGRIAAGMIEMEQQR
jgi:negative regulator of flagellin synthesis FlgM